MTVTLNAALDRTLIAPELVLGSSRTVDVALTQGGGKGLNVARALRVLGHEVMALGFAGGLTGEWMRRSLTREGLPHELAPIEGDTRICTAILDPGAGMSTEVNEPGPAILPEEVANFEALFDEHVQRARLVCLCGSLPPGLPADYYAQLIVRARRVDVPCILDTRDEALLLGLAAGPLLIKPNQHEAATVFGAHSGADIRRAVNSHGHQPGVPSTATAVTLGSRGASLHTNGGSWRAEAPRVVPVDTVGAGDAFVAGFAATLLDCSGEDGLAQVLAQPGAGPRILRAATAAATASVLTVGAGRFRREDMVRLASEIRIESISGAGK